jgi:hypothetical protein
MLEIRGAAPGLLDDPLLLDVGGAPPNAALSWRARLRDDDGFVWRAEASRPEDLLTAWAPAKPSAGTVAALRSLRPVTVDVRVEAPDGAASARTITRTLLADGVRVRRWREGVAGSLYRPASPVATLVLDARPSGPGDAAPGDVWPVAAALLASRGVLVFAVTGAAAKAAGDPPAVARELLAAVPGAPTGARQLEIDALPVPPGLGGPADPAAWDALLADLGAIPRRLGR